MVKWIKKHWEVLSYLVFGVLCTLLNIVLYALFNKLFGYTAAIAIIGGADGPTAIFVTGLYDAQALWGLAVKVFSNVLVIVLNYLFSKLIIFKKK